MEIQLKDIKDYSEQPSERGLYGCLVTGEYDNGKRFFYVQNCAYDPSAGWYGGGFDNYYFEDYHDNLFWISEKLNISIEVGQHGWINPKTPIEATEFTKEAFIKAINKYQI